VTSDPEGISCGNNCHEFPVGTQVTLNAKAGDASVFKRWSAEDCSDSVAPCVMTLDTAGPRQVTATFEINVG
jgi:Divergent InlB B-repeat domain